MITADEELELVRLAEALLSAVSHMESRLIETSALVRASLDPARETELRRKFELEFRGTGHGLLEALGR